VIVFAENNSENTTESFRMSASDKDKKNGKKHKLHVPSFGRSKGADSKHSGKDRPTDVGRHGQESKGTGSQQDATSGASSSSITHTTKQTSKGGTREHGSHGHPDGPAHVRPTVSSELKIDVKVYVLHVLCPLEYNVAWSLM